MSLTRKMLHALDPKHILGKDQKEEMIDTTIKSTKKIKGKLRQAVTRSLSSLERNIRGGFYKKTSRKSKRKI